MRIERHYILSMLAVLVLFSALYTSKLEPFYSFSLRFNDINFALQDKQASQEVLLIAIDEASVNRFGRWPWKRDVLATAINSVNDETLLIFDMVFSEPTDEDAILASSLQEQDNSICGFFLRHKDTSQLTSIQEEALSDASLERLSSQMGQERLFIKGAKAEVNVDTILDACSLSATFSSIRDSDQLLRKYPLAFVFNEELIPSIGIQAIRMHEGKDISYDGAHDFSIASHHFSSDERGFGRLNYYALDSYKIHSFLDLYEGHLTKEYLRNKIIILGLSEVGLGDIRVTPQGQIPGALVHYTFISNVLNNELLHENRLITLMSVILLALLPLIWIVVGTLYKRVLVYTLVYGGFFVATKLLFLYNNLYLDAFYPLVGLLFSAIVSEALLYKKQENEIGFIKDAFSAYLSPELLKSLMHNPTSLKLGGEKKELTIFFSDIRAFTSMSEKMDAQELTHYLNLYFTPMSALVTQHNGMIDKYIGDSLMAFYNAPVDVPEHASDACTTALEMIDTLKVLNRVFKEKNLPELSIGIGLNTAEVAVGNMGSSQRFNYTVIGDGVNLASRVEGLNKTFGTTIIITENTKAKLNDQFLLRPLEKVKVKGKDEAVMLYELMENSTVNRMKVESFINALLLYNEENFEAALSAFTALVEEDKVCQYFIHKIVTR